MAGIELEETAGERYIVCSRDQYSTLELAEEMAKHFPSIDLVWGFSLSLLLSFSLLLLARLFFPPSLYSQCFHCAQQDAWKANEEVQKTGASLKPSTNNTKICKLFGVDDLIPMAVSVKDAVESLKAEGHI